MRTCVPWSRDGLILSICLVLGSVVWAQPPGGPGQPGAVQGQPAGGQNSPPGGMNQPPGGPGQGGFRFPSPPVLATLDANSDGEITADEMANAVEALRKLDKNSDGELASDELMPFRGGFGGPGGAMRRQTMKVLEKFDVDKDGVLRKDERAEARKFIKENMPNRGFGGPGFGGPGGGPGGPGGGPGGPGFGPPGGDVLGGPGFGPPGGGPDGGFGPGFGMGPPDGDMGPGFGPPDGPPGFGPPDTDAQSGNAAPNAEGQAGRGMGGRDMGGRDMGGRGRGGRGGGGPFGGERTEPSQPGKQLTPDDVKQYQDEDLYDPTIIRTIFLNFENQDWEEELEDFRMTDVDVPAEMIVDGKSYVDVGVRFRGNTSYMGIPRGSKRSLNLSIDYGKPEQRLQGRTTLNLLNAHSDPSFVRGVLYNRISRDYVPTADANFVRVVINGENWGIYTNDEQVNKDFLKKWFGDSSGARWKIPPNFSGASGLMYLGDDLAQYKQNYEIKTKDNEEDWKKLVELCRVLKQTPVEQREAEFDKRLNVDEALWFLAVDNVLGDGDGYFSRASDYNLYLDKRFNRFYLFSHDNNETFRSAEGPGMGPGGPGGFGGPGGRGGRGGGPGMMGGPDGGPGMMGGPDGGPGMQGGPEGRREGGPDVLAGPDGGPDMPGGPGGGPGGFGGIGGPGGGPGRTGGGQLDPLSMVDSENRPLISALLSVPNYRARYLAHVRTITEKWMDWNTLGPVVESYRSLIDADIKDDTKKLTSYENFANAEDAEETGGRGPFGPPPGIRRFVEARGKYLLAHPEMSKPQPNLVSVTHQAVKSGGAEPAADEAVQVTAKVEGDPQPQTVLLYYASQPGAPFTAMEMVDDGKHQDAQAGDGVYGAVIPGCAGNCEVRYYVEARAAAELGTTRFMPAEAELGAYRYQVAAAPVTDSPLVINEFMVANKRLVKDAQGEFHDWIELYNRGDKDVDASGMYLSDSKSKPTKWAFPQGTIVPPHAALIVWLDGARAKDSGSGGNALQANFKLSKKGETIYLFDSDARGNNLLDEISYSRLAEEVSFGRLPDGKPNWQAMYPTPGKTNRDQEKE